jgi:hypothetical protein
MKFAQITLFVLFMFSTAGAVAQTVIRDSANNITPRVDTIVRAVKDSIITKDTVARHDPRKATRRSALIPGWGQAYNKEYWKIPFVYGVIGVPAGFFIYNNTWYKRSKKAFEIVANKDSNRYGDIHPDLQKRPTTSEQEYLSALQQYRNSFRRDRDYSVLYFLVAWGLQVADATVFGHLKEFDVSDDLSFHIKPGYSPMAHTSGLSLVLAVRNTSKPNYSSR